MRKERLELSRVSPLDSKSSASASSATFARAVRTARAGCGHTCRPCVGVSSIIADGNLPPAHRSGSRSGGCWSCNSLFTIAVGDRRLSPGRLRPLVAASRPPERCARAPRGARARAASSAHPGSAHAAHPVAPPIGFPSCSRPVRSICCGTFTRQVCLVWKWTPHGPHC